MHQQRLGEAEDLLQFGYDQLKSASNGARKAQALDAGRRLLSLLEATKQSPRAESLKLELAQLSDTP